MTGAVGLQAPEKVIAMVHAPRVGGFDAGAVAGAGPLMLPGLPWPGVPGVPSNSSPFRCLSVSSGASLDGGAGLGSVTVLFLCKKPRSCPLGRWQLLNPEGPSGTIVMG